MLDDNTALHSLVTRSFDAKEANRIINDPSVFPQATPHGLNSIDVTEIISNPRNVLLMAEGGALLFGADIDSCIYELHTSFLPDFRGMNALAVSRDAYRWMFTHTDCLQIWTRVPVFNRAAALMARKIGFVPQFTRHNAWQTADGPCDVRFYLLDYHHWLHLAADGLMASGRRFHRQLDEQRAAMGNDDPHHPDEDSHDLYVGVCLETVYGGQPEKAIILYNRWARLSGYGQISLVATNPLVVDIGDAVLLIEDQSFQILRIK